MGSYCFGNGSQIKDENIKGSFPSLYLNIGKCYEDLNEFDLAKKNYQLADSYLDSSLKMAMVK